jgi:hypothetical protein
LFSHLDIVEFELDRGVAEEVSNGSHFMKRPVSLVELKA